MGGRGWWQCSWSVHGGVEVDAGDGEEGTGSVDKTRAGVENSKAGSWKPMAF